ncbi:MAG: hypothetical protein VW547_10435 [Alphaproteobacteria bacterium]|jgi:hypothetical protein
MTGTARHATAAYAVLFGVALVAVAWPRTISGALVAPYEEMLRGIARGANASLAAVHEARTNSAVSATWFAYGGTLNRLGALYLVRARFAKDREAQRVGLVAAIVDLREGLARPPGAS